MVKILGLGHPRTGTMFTSTCLRHWGLKAYHENMGPDGIIAWQFINEEGGAWTTWTENNIGNRPECEHLLYNLRNPYYTIPSTIYTENINSPSYDLRRDLFNIDTHHPIEFAIESIIGYDLKVREMNHFAFRVEDQMPELFNYLSDYYDIKWHPFNYPVNSKSHPTYERAVIEFGKPSNRHINMINNYCIKYGYGTIEHNIYLNLRGNK